MEFARWDSAAHDLKTLLGVKIAAFAAALLALIFADRLNNIPVLATTVEVVASAICLGLLFLPVADHEPIHNVRLNPFLALLLGASGALAGALGWLHGTPAFVHDWKWPLDSLQSHDQLTVLGSIWLPWGSGAPAIQALGNYPIAILGWAIGYVLPSNLALLAVLALIGACAGWGIAGLAARTGLSKPYQATLALSFTAMPAWFNRLDAGHLEWLLGYALLPAALSIAISGAHPRKVAGGLGALWGIAGGQAQFLLFFPLVALPLAVQSRRLAAASAGLLLMIAVQLPAIVAMIYAHRLGAFASQQTNLTWQMAQSDPLGLALLSGADPAHYFAHWQGGAAFALSLGIIVCAAIGAFSSTLTRILAATWLLCALWSSGLDGPLAIPIAWTFAHVPEAIALREFAHTQAVVAPLLAILGAHGISRIVGALRAGAWIGAVATFLALLPLTAAAFSGATTGIAIPIAHSSDRDAVVADIEALPGSGQVLWWPGLAPIALRTDATRGGVDSEALVTGEHAPYAEYRPTAALAQAIVALGSGDRAACGLLADLGVQAVIVRDGTFIPTGTAFSPLVVPSAATAVRAGLREVAARGSYHLYAVPCYRGRVTIADDAQITGDWSSIVPIARRLGATDERTSPPSAPAGCAAVPFVAPTYRSTDITRNWVQLSELDSQFLKFDNAFDDVLVTRDPAEQLRSWVLAAPAGASYAWIPPQRANRLLPNMIGVWQIAHCRAGARPRRRPVSSAALPKHFNDGTIYLSSPTLIVAHYGSYAGWSLLVDGEDDAKPILADGYATGWLLRSGQWSLALVPSGPPIGLLWAIALLTCTLCLIQTCLPYRK
ncbi:MAG: hypothetical protein WCA80_11360 [Candidatus Aquilonibacter sp.]